MTLLQTQKNIEIRSRHGLPRAWGVSERNVHFLKHFLQHEGLNHDTSASALAITIVNIVSIVINVLTSFVLILYILLSSMLLRILMVS